jgi:sugar-specific transcriptional regulator TrmB
VILESLKKKGLVGQAEKTGTQVFYAEDPSHLEDLIAEKHKEVEHIAEELRDTVPELRKMYAKGGNRPVVRYFEGDEGLQRLRKEMGKRETTTTDLAFTDLDALLAKFPGLYSRKTSARVEQKRDFCVLYTSHKGPVRGMNDPKRYRKGRWVSFKKELDFEGDISIFENKVSITSFRGEPVSILIEHDDITRLIKALFTLAWEGAEDRNEPEPTVSLGDIDRK